MALSRREFLRRAALTAGGVSLGLNGIANVMADSPGLLRQDVSDFTVVIVDSSDPAREAFDTVIVPRLMEENPGLNVTVNYSAWGRYNEEMTTAFAAGVTPDVFQGGAVWVPQMAQRGWVVPLTGYLEGDEDYDWEDFPEPLRIDSTLDGEILAIPYSQDLRTLWYRQDYLEEAGFDAPPTNWDEFLEVAIATTKKNGDSFEVEGYHLSSALDGWQQLAWQPYLIWLHTAGGDFLSEDMTHSTLDEQPALDALQFLYDLIHEHGVMPFPGLDPQGDLEPVVAGQAATQFDNAFLERDMNLYAPDQAEAVWPALPLTGELQATHVWVDKFFISSQSPNPDGAWDVLRFMTRRDMLGVYNAANNITPPRLSLLDADYMTEKHQLLLQASQYAFTYPQHPRLVELFRPVAAELEQSLSGNKAPADALADASAAVNAILAEDL